MERLHDAVSKMLEHGARRPNTAVFGARAYIDLVKHCSSMCGRGVEPDTINCGSCNLEVVLSLDAQPDMFYVGQRDEFFPPLAPPKEKITIELTSADEMKHLIATAPGLIYGRQN